MTRQRKALRPKYLGQLARRMRQTELLPILSPLIKADTLEDRLKQERLQRLVLLLEHYSIKPEPDCWLRLALQLAVDHVPGFQLTDSPAPGRPKMAAIKPLLGLLSSGKRRGAPVKWDFDNCGHLLTILEYGTRRLRQQGKPHRNVDAIAEAIARKFPEKHSAWRRRLAEKLAKRVSECRSTLRKIEGNYK